MFPSKSSFQFSKVKASHLMNNSVFHTNLKQILGMPIRNLKKVELKNNLIGKVFCS